MQVAFFCWFRQALAGMSWDLARDVPDLENFMQENFGQIFRSLVVVPPEVNQRFHHLSLGANFYPVLIGAWKFL